MHALSPCLHLLPPALALVCQLVQVLSEDMATLASLNSPPSDGGEGALPSPWPLALCVSPPLSVPHIIALTTSLVSASVLLSALSHRHTQRVTNETTPVLFYIL